jgi:FMN phosphatase YigB (HAD superfamily)
MIKNLSKTYKLMISSNTDDEILKENLKIAGIYDYFEIVFGGSIREK